MPYTLVQRAQTVDLGRNGSKWRHGWIPLNAAATAIKLKREHASGPSSSAGSNRLAGDLAAERRRDPSVRAHHEAAKALVGFRLDGKSQQSSSSGKSRLSTSGVRPSRLKLKSDKGRASSNDHGITKADLDTMRAGSGAPREFKTTKQRRDEASARGNTTAKGHEVTYGVSPGATHIGTLTTYGGTRGMGAGSYGAQHVESDKPHSGGPFKTKREAVGALVLQHEARHPEAAKPESGFKATHTERGVRIPNGSHTAVELTSGKGEVQNRAGHIVSTHNSYRAAVAERNRRNAAESTAGKGSTIAKPESTYDKTAKAYSDSKRTESIADVGTRLHGADRTRWKVDALRTQAQFGDAAAKAELARRAANRAAKKAAAPPKVNPRAAVHKLATNAEAKAAHRAELDRGKPGFGASSNLRHVPVKEQIARADANRRQSQAEGLSAQYISGKGATANDDKILTARAVQMFGSDRSKWSATNIKAAAKHGDAAAKAELARRAKAGSGK